MTLTWTQPLETASCAQTQKDSHMNHPQEVLGKGTGFLHTEQRQSME